MSSKLPNDPKRNRQEPFGEIIKSMNQFFHEKPIKGFLQTIDDFFKNPFPAVSFPVEVRETDNEHIITAELPGVKRDQIQIHVLGSSLTITVHKEEIITEQDDIHRTYRNRQSYQRLSRTISLNHAINERKIKASHHDGLLEIRIPKLRGKKIVIDSE